MENRHQGEDQKTTARNSRSQMLLFWKTIKMRHYSIAIVCILLTNAGCSVATNASPSDPHTAEISSQAAAIPSSSHGPSLETIVGNWEATYLGRQVLTTRPDGTATIEMCLTPMAAVAYGKRITLDLRWTLEGSELTQTIVGGAPENSVRKLIAKFGSTQCYRVLEFQRDHLLVSNSKADSKPIRWTAVAKLDGH